MITTVTKPILTDETGQNICSALNAIEAALLKNRFIGVDRLPSATADNVGVIYILLKNQSNYVRGGIYQSTLVPDSDPATYEWVLLANVISADGVSTEINSNGVLSVINRLETTNELPIPNADHLGEIKLLLANQNNYNKGGIYECTSDGAVTPTYSWTLISTADLTFDNTPTEGSNNPVTSNGIYEALETKINVTDIAQVESSSTAGNAYSAGEYLYYNEKLYKVKTDIAVGDEIITEGPNANVEDSTVTSAIEEAEPESLNNDQMDNLLNILN